ncbi:hypothetical protein E2C01_095704 [Portunus trituberculatus]|uniref:Uncharacterized protein n=1 Tax=Portunus trituberculatus TaxID=210409 RepID=A0A5B7K0U8_PORTR|nr:hypothetical protein [Portunus trituberculatus]
MYVPIGEKPVQDVFCMGSSSSAGLGWSVSLKCPEVRVEKHQRNLITEASQVGWESSPSLSHYK